jgi:nitrogen fixation protein NifU and related proteins
MSGMYQDVILDHSKRPRHFGEMPDATHTATGRNALCGDEITIHIRQEDGRMADVSFTGRGCAISMASASVMTTMVTGKTTEETAALFARFQEILTGTSLDEALAPLTAFAELSHFPTRRKCAMLAWQTLLTALEDDAFV